jgi:hypothetical protein
MARVRPRVEVIKQKLRLITAILNGAAYDFRDAKLRPRRNIRHVGEALMSIFAILDDVYRARPDLLPRYLVDTELGRRALSNKQLERTGLPRRRKAGRRSVGRSTAGR